MERIQLSRRKGFRLPEGAVSVARPTRWGNPFRVGDRLSFPYDAFGPVVRDRAHAVEIFAAHARITSGYEGLVRRDLAGKDLACWCPLPAEGEPDICHAAVLLRIACGTEGSPWREALQDITGDSWLDDLARASLVAAEAKFTGPGAAA